jgi:hypothetical protein
VGSGQWAVLLAGLWAGADWLPLFLWYKQNQNHLPQRALRITEVNLFDRDVPGGPKPGLEAVAPKRVHSSAFRENALPGSF